MPTCSRPGPSPGPRRGRPGTAWPRAWAGPGHDRQAPVGKCVYQRPLNQWIKKAKAESCSTFSNANQFYVISINQNSQQIESDVTILKLIEFTYLDFEHIMYSI